MNQETSLSGKRVLLTGGTTGIGRATLAALAREGARLLTFGRDPQAMEEAVRDARDAGGEIHAITADVSTKDGIAAVYEAVDTQLGGIDMLVANAALGAQPIHEMADEDWRKVIDTNLVGYLACAREAILRMEPAGGGHLLFVGSISTEIKAEGESVYAATKAGIQAFAETLRKEVAPKNIKVSVIQPGSVATDMQECSEEEKQQAVAKEEMLHAAEVADAIRYVLTRSPRTDILNLRIEPRIQKTS